MAILQSLQNKRAVIIEYPYYVKTIALFARALGLPVLMTFHDKNSKMCKNRIRRFFVEQWEIEAGKSADFVATVAQDEHEYFNSKGIKNFLCPTTTDVYKSRSVLGINTCTANKIMEQAGLNFENFLFFVGHNNTPNRDAVKYIRHIAMESARQSRPWLFVIAGSCCLDNTDTENIKFLGQVSLELLYALYAKSRLIISPLFLGSGSSVKTVEAMGAGKVILGSTFTFRGLKVTDGIECLIEDNVDNYLSRIDELLESEGSSSILEQISEKARQFSLSYDYRICLRPYVDFLENWSNDDLVLNVDSKIAW
jgi:glycosyltransferase involved in cell wall biosynthesis